jgi:hypothetical protein
MLKELASAALRPAAQLGRDVDRRTRHALSESSRRALLSSLDVTLATVDGVLSSEVLDEVAARVRASGVLDRLDTVVSAAADSPEVAKLIGTVLGSRAVDTAFDLLLENDALWRVVDEVAKSPAVSRAISHQSVTFADEVADVARNRARGADDRLERLARRLTGQGRARAAEVPAHQSPSP